MNQEPYQLIEIYKLQSQLANDISNRKIAVNRYYLIVLSLVLVALATMLKSDENSNMQIIFDVVSIDTIIIIIGIIGLILSGMWFKNIHSYIVKNFKKYESIKKWEKEMEYKIIEEEYKLPEYKRSKNYFQQSQYELITPLVFCVIFAVITVFGARTFDYMLIRIVLRVIALVTIVFITSPYIVFFLEVKNYMRNKEKE